MSIEIEGTIDTTTANHGYILIYNDYRKVYEFINPDEILDKSAKEPVQPGLPQDFLSEVINSLDNNIDLDAGIW